ncbi:MULTISPECIES: tRNA1(Val) (adenine(37)-N6)-methyltransferase [Bacillaceae]|uniref:tRNA1(Val) (Adenine(37)-N6)-methyltransferase n=1 Tax=Evansella alkalicola TaxID=745819 RepID=A0ABS6JXM7_9BACI|nr:MULTISPECIES: tRNA1(Val) (adenine(37)-N6)-methyltransferase [Bacillaceae]MBU9721977.1 tRNA1(Val) (adenine(37)-N6)-methyltransferase [Bacillus alkalicola]
MTEKKGIEYIHYMPGKKRYIYQRNDIFSFSIDAVLLAKFAKAPKATGKIIDLCTGTGAIPLLLSTRTSAPIDAVEIQSLLCELAEKSIKYNDLEGQISLIHKNILDLDKEVSWGSYDLVTCNPPYFTVTSDQGKNRNEKISYARHEIACTLDDVIRICARLVNQTGKIAMVHRPERLADIIITMRKYKVEPKVIQYVHPRKDREANMILIEAVRGGKPGLKTYPPFFVYGDGQEYTKEFKEYYETW